MANGLLAFLIALIVGVGVGWYIGSSQPTRSPQPTKTVAVTSSKEEALKMDMRKLWEDHVTWTRLYIESAISGSPDTDSNLSRLMKNQEDIGNSIKPYYGTDAGDKLTKLLKEHIRLAGELVKAAINKDVAAVAKANKDWSDNGNDIADFLASANPSWPKDQLRSMISDHLNLTRQEAVDILAKRYDASVADYDKIQEQILNMADMLSNGIIKQFPDKFQGSMSSPSGSPMGSPSSTETSPMSTSIPAPTSAPRSLY